MNSGLFKINNSAVFPSTFNWMTKSDAIVDAFGRIGGAYYTVASVKESGEISHWETEGDIDQLRTQNQMHMSPTVFFLGYNASQYQKDVEPEAFSTGRYFVPFDIDNPSIRKWYGQLFKGYIPETKVEAGKGARMHLLANEPHFATREGGWFAENGVSGHTKENYKKWLINRYSNKIENLNKAYGTNYSNFGAARDGMKVPVNTDLQGGPIWYDWCRFNMDRVTNWFSFLKQSIQKQDSGVPVTIKILGWIMGSEWRDHGMDIEALAKLQDVLGSDLNTTPFDAVDSRSRKEDWVNHYSIEWVEQSMALDFYKSIAPGKPFYDSEWHGLANDYHHINMKPEYVRAGLWLAHTHGMNMIESWVWGRKADGDPSDVNSIFYAEATTQPWVLDAYGRTLKELNAHSNTVVKLADKKRKFRIFYSEDSAIQDKNYIAEMKAVYEALKLANFDVGFTTPSEIGKLTADHVLIVPPTPYQSYWAYKKVQDFPGKKVLVNADKSFKKNEHGKTRSNPNVSHSHAIAFGDPETMARKLNSAIGSLKVSPSVGYKITDVNGKDAFGLFVNQAKNSQTGDTTVSVINVSRKKRKFSLNVSGKVTDIITGKSISATQTLDPYDVLVVSTGKSASGNGLNHIEAPANIDAGARYSVAVNYTADQSFDLELHLVNKTTWKTVAKVEKVVWANVGQNTWFPFDVPAGIAAGNYEWRALLIPRNKTWQEAVEIINKPVTVGAGTSLPTGWINLQFKHSEKCLDLKNGLQANGAKIRQWDCSAGNTNQNFKLVSKDSGFYELRTKHDKCLGVSSGSKANSAKVIQWQCTGSQDQQFRLEENGAGWYELSARHSEKCLDVSGISTANGALITQYQCHDGPNQSFKIIESSNSSAPANWVSLEIKHSGKCLDLKAGSQANGTGVHQWGCNANNTNQDFKLVSKGSGYYELRTKHNKCVGVGASSTSNGAGVVQWDCTGVNDQQFLMNEKGSGWFELKARHSNKCLDIANISKSNGAEIYQWQCLGADNQLFRIK